MRSTMNYQAIETELRQTAAALEHRYCEDGYYACPKHEDSFGHDGEECDCELEQRRSLLIRAADAIVRLGRNLDGVVSY